jgi:LCP family protein required for cell wall assembly
LRRRKRARDSADSDGAGSGDPPKPRRRWRRRLFIGFGSLVLIAILLAGGVVYYAHWRYDEIPKIQVHHLVKRVAGKPFDVLLVGSDSRQFVDDSSEAGQFGTTSNAGGQRSDVIIVARIVPALREVKLLSIPRDTYVDIPGNTPISGPNRINAAFNSGAALLVQTISDSFHLPVSNYVQVNFPGLINMVDAVGGVYLDFPDPVRDSNSHLGIARTGCHLVLGKQALALVRSRDLSYELDGYWHYDGLGDLSRIQRQDAFFRALLPRLSGVIGSPTGVNDLLGAAVKNLTFDKTLSEDEVLSLGRLFHGMPSSSLTMETLPTIPWTTSGGADVQLPAAAQDEQMIANFLAFGTSTKAVPIGTTTTTAVPGSQSAPTTTTTATSPGSVTTTSVPSNVATSSSIPASSEPGVTVAPTTTVASGLTVTTVPSSAPTSSADVQTNTQIEPWNPFPCNGAT